MDTLLIVGDSISSAYDIDKDLGWTKMLSDTVPFSVVNISTPGATSMLGRSKFIGATKEVRPNKVIIELGINDIFKDVPVDVFVANIKDIIDRSIEFGASVLILDVISPACHKWGGEDCDKLVSAVNDIVDDYGVDLIRIDLSVFAVNGLLLDDGLHPNEYGNKEIFDRMSDYFLRNK